MYIFNNGSIYVLNLLIPINNTFMLKLSLVLTLGIRIISICVSGYCVPLVQESDP